MLGSDNGVANSIIGGGGGTYSYIRVHSLTDHENNRFQTKLTVQNMNI